MNARILPDESDFEINPHAAEQLEAERQALASRPPEHNEATQAWIETESELDKLNALDAARQAAKAAQEPESPAARQQPASVAVDHDKRSAEIEHNFRAGANVVRDQAELLAVLAPPQPTSNAGDTIDDETEFFVNPKEAVARAVANHPALAALKNAAQDTLQRKTTEQFVKEFPDVRQTMQDPEFREWVQASPIRTELLKVAHENYDLDAAREVFGNWKALRGAASSGKGKVKIYRRADVQRLMEENPSKYEKLEPEIARAYKQGRVK